MARMFPAQKKPTQNLAITYIWKEVVMAEKVLKKTIPTTVMVMLFLRPMLSANLPRTNAPKKGGQPYNIMTTEYQPSMTPAMKADMVPLLL